MAYERREQPDDQITLFRNDQARGEKDPTYKGSGKVNGRDYWCSGWVNVSRKDGSKYLKVKFQPKQEQRRENYDRQRKEEPSRDEFEDEIPF